MTRSRLGSPSHALARIAPSALASMLGALFLLTSATVGAQSREHNPVAVSVAADANREAADSTDRIIIKWRDTDASAPTPTARRTKATRLLGMTLSAKPSISATIDVVQLPASLGGAALKAAIDRLQADPQVEYASPDLRRHILAVTSDPLLSQQWYLLSDQPAATRTDKAWDVTHGDANVVVAVLDTGVRFEHPDLGRSGVGGGKVLPGYDFITNIPVANDGDGRDADPSDPGDWVTDADKLQSDFTKCTVAESSWHGTRTSGLIGAITDNGFGVAGAAWNTTILPVRVLGKCGGFDSDIIAGMLWAAGVPVAGVPANPNPAKIINLSLGSTGACSAAYRNAVNQITARGVLIVASAGNEGGPVGTPGNCLGVLGVSGLRHIGTKVGFSSLGPEIGISAPGGNCGSTDPAAACQFSITAATNTGAMGPVGSSFTDSTPGNSNLGTSFSGPMVAAAAALLAAVHPALTPPQLILLLKQSATPFPVSTTGAPVCHVPASSADLQKEECSCTTQTCGAGMLNTGAAIAASMGPLAVVRTTGDVVAGGSIALNGSSSFSPNGHTLSTFQWSVVNATGTVPVVAAPAELNTTLSISAAGTFTVRLTVTDDQGTADSAETTLTAAAAPPTPPAPAPTPMEPTPPATFANTGGGGGGALGWEVLVLGMLWASRKLQPDRSSSRVD